MFVDALVFVGTLRVIERVEFVESGEFVVVPLRALRAARGRCGLNVCTHR